jgi:DNA-binding transcriptional LysR family regulator
VKDGPTYLTFDIIAYSQSIKLPIWDNTHAAGLYAAWRATDGDDELNDLIEWLRDDIAERIDFDVEDVH